MKILRRAAAKKATGNYPDVMCRVEGHVVLGVRRSYLYIVGIDVNVAWANRTNIRDQPAVLGKITRAPIRIGDQRDIAIRRDVRMLGYAVACGNINVATAGTDRPAHQNVRIASAVWMLRYVDEPRRGDSRRFPNRSDRQSASQLVFE